LVGLLTILFIGMLLLWIRERRLRKREMVLNEYEAKEKDLPILGEGTRRLSMLRIHPEVDLGLEASRERRLTRRIEELEAQRQPSCVFFKFGIF
jgi:hypothetical protein